MTVSESCKPSKLRFSRSLQLQMMLSRAAVGTMELDRSMSSSCNWLSCRGGGGGGGKNDNTLNQRNRNGWKEGNPQGEGEKAEDVRVVLTLRRQNAAFLCRSGGSGLCGPPSSGSAAGPGPRESSPPGPHCATESHPTWTDTRRGREAVSGSVLRSLPPPWDREDSGPNLDSTANMAPKGF